MQHEHEEIFSNGFDIDGGIGAVKVEGNLKNVETVERGA